jgi:hypothetical protein
MENSIGQFLSVKMKRLLGTVCCLLTIFAGAVAAWADCTATSLNNRNTGHASSRVHSHEHHAEPDHSHSHDGVMHCPALDEFLTVANVSASTERQFELVLLASDSQWSSQSLRRGSALAHGPPGFAYSGIIPSYLLLGVLRI